MAQGAKTSAKTKKTNAKTLAKASKSARAAHSKTPKIANQTGKAKGLDLLRRISLKRQNTKIDDFRAGDTVNVYVKVKEGEKERIQVYKGLVTKIQGAGASKTFTVRKISSGVGVERTFPFLSPAVDRVEILNVGHVRRSKLYYLRRLEGKAAKIESDLVMEEGGVSAEGSTTEASEEAAPAPAKAKAEKSEKAEAKK